MHIKSFRQGRFYQREKETEYESVGNSITGRAVVLPPGRYEVRAQYETTSTGITGNKNYKTKDPVTCTLDLESGFQYSLGVYFNSAEERASYYKGDVGEAVCETALDVSGFGSGYKEAYVIGYKEKDMYGNDIRTTSFEK